MYNALPRPAGFWSVLLAIDHDLAETTRKNSYPAVDACMRPTTCVSRVARPNRFPGHSASDSAFAVIVTVAEKE